MFSSSGKCVAVLTGDNIYFIKDNAQGHVVYPCYCYMALCKAFSGTCGQLCGHVDKGQLGHVRSDGICEILSQIIEPMASDTYLAIKSV